ncbi:single-stranded DNA-binding protein [Amycolatopsis sp. H20-H5]|uniref:single-stranded DNA-binding protein n=1 Tax=Amycolatopsis sp. H20-H5 TaxID=3046309 RepID=UPI002DB9D3B2|nr:single-stranded DNA-binding protein [Amycolatopsis sp. H20-H5]MEC3978432.1 single-stranded DNA-binding protein [Amycolatopsis sp. H20-H5]
MAVGETWITMVGRLTSEPVHHQEPERGHDVVSFGLLNIERRFDRERGEWTDGRELEVRVTCRRKLAAGVHSCLGKGDPVVVTGRLSSGGPDVAPRSRAVLELEAFAVGPDLGRCVAGVRRPVRAANSRPEWRGAVENGLVSAAESVPAA